MLVSSRQTGASTDSLTPPLTSPPLPGPGSSSRATRSSVPSHGIRGWFQHTQARRRPSGEGAGNA